MTLWYNKNNYSDGDCRGRGAPRPYTLLGLRPLVGLRQVRAINQSPLPCCTTRGSVGAGWNLGRSAWRGRFQSAE